MDGWSTVPVSTQCWMVMKTCHVLLQIPPAYHWCVHREHSEVRRQTSAWYISTSPAVQIATIFSSAFTWQRRRQHGHVSSFPMKVFYTRDTSSSVGRAGCGFIGRGSAWGRRWGWTGGDTRLTNWLIYVIHSNGIGIYFLKMWIRILWKKFNPINNTINVGFTIISNFRTN